MNYSVRTRPALPVLVLAIAFGMSAQRAHAQLFSVTTSQPNGFTTNTNVKVCQIPNAPNGGCVSGGFTTSVNNPPDMLYVVAGELADVRQQLTSLQAEIGNLKQSNEDTANATKQAANSIASQNSDFNKEFRDTILQKLQNYPADFVNSDAYKQLKNDLMKYIDQKVAAQNPAGKQPAANPPQALNSRPVQAPAPSAEIQPSETRRPATPSPR